MGGLDLELEFFKEQLIKLGANMMRWNGCSASKSEQVLQPSLPRRTPVVGDSRLLGAGGMQQFECPFL